MSRKNLTDTVARKERKIAQPVEAWLTVNRACNFRCKWCYAQGDTFDRRKEIALDLAFEMTHILHSIGIQHLFITGGEPTLWNSLFQYNAFCREIGMETTLVTNGMRFGNDTYWQQYLQEPNTYVGISLKAANPRQLREATQVRQFAQVTKGITRAMTHFQSGVGIVYNTYCADNLVEMVEYALSCRAKTVKLDFCTPVFVSGEPKAVNLVEPRVLVENIIRDYPRLVEITEGNLAFIMSVPFCIWPKEFIQELKAKNRIESVCHLTRREGIVIGCDGSLYMCNELFDFPIGKYLSDFNDGESLINFLNSPQINKYYDELSRYPSKFCQECSWYNDCGGGCPLQWSVFDPDKLVHPIG